MRKIIFLLIPVVSWGQSPRVEYGVARLKEVLKAYGRGKFDVSIKSDTV